MISVIFQHLNLNCGKSERILRGCGSNLRPRGHNVYARTMWAHLSAPWMPALKKRCQVTMQRFTLNILKPVFSVPKNLGNLSKSHKQCRYAQLRLPGFCDSNSLGLRWLNPWSKLFPVAPGSNDRVIPSAQSKMASMNGSQRKEGQFEVQLLPVWCWCCCQQQWWRDDYKPVWQVAP